MASEKPKKEGKYVYNITPPDLPRTSSVKNAISKGWGSLMKSKKYRERSEREKVAGGGAAAEEPRKVAERRSVSAVEGVNGGTAAAFLQVKVLASDMPGLMQVEFFALLVPQDTPPHAFGPKAYTFGPKIENFDTFGLKVEIFDTFGPKNLHFWSHRTRDFGTKSVKNFGFGTKSVKIFGFGTKNVSFGTKSVRRRVLWDQKCKKLMQVHAFRCARTTYDSLDKFSSKYMAYNIKKEFDKVYGPAWHCIVGSSFGSFVTHSTGCFLYFSMEKLYILVFKTKVERAVLDQL